MASISRERPAIVRITGRRLISIGPRIRRSCFGKYQSGQAGHRLSSPAICCSLRNSLDNRKLLSVTQLIPGRKSGSMKSNRVGTILSAVPGPRATPTLADGALYAQGALGTLQRLDPMTGEVVWTRDIQKAAGCKPPEWGFSSSPLVIDSVVVVHAGRR